MTLMPRAVRPLPPEVVERIAAGEVILGPAAAVKELVENALDAGATSIDIEVRHGGLDLIRVRDNGSGIIPSDLDAVYRRHATSKIAALDDLDSITTYGFRGEALASLLAVADVTLTTAATPGHGITVRYQNGAPTGRTRSPRDRGTTVAVHNLFQSIPARLALVQQDTRKELAAVALLVRRCALAAPGARFTLTVDGRQDFHSPGNGDRRAVLAAWYGAALAGALVPLPETQPGGARLSGWVSGPERSWTARRHLHLFINGRWVEPRPLLEALESAYRPLLPRGRHPLAAVFLEVPPALVDLNVHPGKLDVRLRWEAETAAGLAAAVREALSSRLATPWPDDDLALSLLNGASPATIGMLGLGSRTLREAVEPYGAPGLPAPTAAGERPGVGSWVSGPRLPPMRAIGQARDALIMAEGPGGLYLVDQHRAHERVLYDWLRTARLSTAPRELVSPLIVQLPRSRHSAALRERLEALGFACRSFAGQAFLVESAPALPDWEPSPDALLAAVNDALPDEDGWEVRLYAALACRTAIRRGVSLERSRLDRLLAGLAAATEPAVCPHGSPLVLHLTPDFLDRRFRW